MIVQELGIPMFEAIKESSWITTACDNGQPLAMFRPTHDARQQYKAIAQRFAELPGK